MPTTPDRIERQIDIDAGVERVYRLISQPGWWINDGVIIDHRIETDGDVSVVHDPKHGAFHIRTVRQDPPRYVSFRWLGGDGNREREENAPGTLVEFWVDERPGGGVSVRVVESGFASLPVSEEERRRGYQDNSEGWEIELGAAKTHLEDG